MLTTALLSLLLLLPVCLADESAQVVISPEGLPPGEPVSADVPAAVATISEPVGPLSLGQPIEVSEPIVLPQDLEERQDTVVRQASSSGKLQHILRAHYVGRLDNEQRFEAQDASEPVPIPRSPRISLNELYFVPPPTNYAEPVAAPAPPTVPQLSPYSYYTGPYGLPYGYHQVGSQPIPRQ